MSASNIRPPIIKKSNIKSPSMAIAKQYKLDMIGELDISVIECSDDRDYTCNNQLNLTEDNIMNSLSHLKTFEKSSVTTRPLRFKDEENKEEDGQDQESNFSSINESVD